MAPALTSEPGLEPRATPETMQTDPTSESRIIELLDSEFAAVFKWPLEGMSRERIAVAGGASHPLAFGVTCSRGFVVSRAIPEGDLRAAVVGCRAQELLSPPIKQRLLALLAPRVPTYDVSENVLFYCAGSTFAPCEQPQAEAVPPDDALFLEWDLPSRLEAAFGVSVEGTRVSEARLIDQGRRPFLAIGVHTRRGRHGMGFAKACVSAATAYALARGQVPLYNAQTDNGASVAVARAIGYREYLTVVSAR